jgi:acetylornithine deacetylase
MPLTAVEQAALRWVETRQRDLVALLQRLVSVPSVVGDEETCQLVVADAMRGCCDTVDVWEPDQAWLDRHPAYFHQGAAFAGRPNVVGIVRGRGGGRSLILNAHVDVVDPGPAEAWTHGPWSGALDDGKLYGRGAVDDKAGLAGMLFAARCLRDLGVSLGGDLILESVVDEEWGGGGTLATLHRGYTADAAIVFEPTDLDLCPAARGGQAFRVTVPGKGAHPIRSYDGVSALEKAIPILAALKDLESDRQERLRTPLFARYPVFAPIVIGKISADRIPSKVPETCVFEGLMGYAPAETYRQAREELERCVGRAAATDAWLRAHPPVVEWLALNKEGAETPAGHPFIRLVAEAFGEAAGRPPVVTGFPAGCDLPYLGRHAGIPSAVFGPGNCTVAHGSNEHVPVDQVVTAARILVLAVLRWCGVRESGEPVLPAV